MEAMVMGVSCDAVPNSRDLSLLLHSEIFLLASAAGIGYADVQSVIMQP